MLHLQFIKKISFLNHFCYLQLNSFIWYFCLFFTTHNLKQILLKIFLYNQVCVNGHCRHEVTFDLILDGGWSEWKPGPSPGCKIEVKKCDNPLGMKSLYFSCINLF